MRKTWVQRTLAYPSMLTKPILLQSPPLLEANDSNDRKSIPSGMSFQGHCNLLKCHAR